MYTFKKDIATYFSQLTLQVMGEDLEKRRLFSGLTDEQGILLVRIKTRFLYLAGREMVFENANNRTS